MTQSFNQIAFPMVQRVMANTIAGKDHKIFEEIKTDIDRENRLRKIRILRSGEFIPEMKIEDHDRYNEWNNSGQIVGVKPLSNTVGSIFHIDYKIGFDN